MRGNNIDGELEHTRLSIEGLAGANAPGGYYLQLERLKRETMHQPGRAEPFYFRFTDNLDHEDDNILKVYNALIERYLERDLLPEETNEDIDYVLEQIAITHIGDSLPSSIDKFLDFHEEYYYTVSDNVYKGNPRYKFLIAVMNVVDELFEWKPVHSITAYKWVLNRIEIYDKYTTDYFEDCTEEDYEYLTGLKLQVDDSKKGGSDESSNDDPGGNLGGPESPVIQWNGPKNVLYDIFVQLCHISAPHSDQPLIGASYPEIAKFLKANFSGFEGPKPSVATITAALQAISGGEKNRPHHSKRINIRTQD